MNIKAETIHFSKQTQCYQSTSIALIYLDWLTVSYSLMYSISFGILVYFIQSSVLVLWEI